MRILLTNDDGIEAPGLGVLAAIAREFSEDVWIVAPDHERSGASRALSLTEPVRVRQAGDKRFSTSGTPSDCVLLGVLELMGDQRPDLILSGVNKGQNIAEDVTFSGTIAAAALGAQMGIRSLAFSQAQNFRFPGSCPWETASIYGAPILRDLLAATWPIEVTMNVNFPDCPPDDVAGTEITRQGQRDELILYVEGRIDLRANPYYWIGYRGKLSNPALNTDLRAIYEKRISITPLRMDLTDAATHAHLERNIARMNAGPRDLPK